jgi:hypothetical protein
MDDREHAPASGAGIAAPAPVRPRPPLSRRAPFDAYSPEELLEHFSTRTDVHFFAVPDESETRRDKIDAVLEHRFALDHERHRLADPIGWTTSPSRDVEWYYAVGLGLAYRDTGDRRYLDQWIALTDSWIAATPPGFIATDVTSRRVQHWIYAYRFFVADADVTAIPPDFHLRFLASLAEQVNFLCAHLTTARHRRAVELYAIFLAGVVFPELSNATGWREFALPELSHQMAADLLPDGVHGELSTGVHHLILKTYLCVRRLAAANRIPVPDRMDAMLIKALEFSMHAHNPIGIVPSFSEGDSRSFLDLLRHGHELFGREDMLFVATRGHRGSRPSARSAAFPDGGYYVVRSGWGEGHRAYADEHHLVFDCGPLGADDRGHFDCLSFELAACGRPLVIDPGRCTSRGPNRADWPARFRSTAFHNTVTVDGQNQTRGEPVPVPESSRTGRGGSRHEVTGPAPEHLLVERVCEDGFDLLHGRVRSHAYDALHERRIFFVGGRYWVIADSLVSRHRHLYEARFHLTESAQGETRIVEAPGLRVVVSPHLLMVQPRQEAVTLALEPGHVSDRYGKKLPAPVVCASTQAARATVVTLLLPYLEMPMLMPVIEPLSITGPIPGAIGGSPGAPARAFAISFGAEQDLLFFGTEPDVEYRFDAFRFRGRYLVVRKNAAGTVTHVHTHAGAELTEAGPPGR